MSMQDQTETIEHEPEAPTFAQQMQGPTLKSEAALVPVNQRGASPVTLEQQITFAQCMMKAKVSTPEFLHGNVGDCLAVVDIATRAGLSPYMLAQKCYQQNGRLSFESQLFHSLLIQSNRLVEPALQARYEGEGDDLVCIVSGTLRGEAKPREHRSKSLGEMHPGHSEKNGKKFVSGSPLWDDKPKVQLFYDTSRDWIRMFCPVAALGILDYYEPIEYPIRQIEGGTLVDRLKAGDKTEGHQNGHAAAELDRVAADNHGLKAAAGQAEAQTTTKKKPGRKTNEQKAAEEAAAQANAAADAAHAAQPSTQEKADAAAEAPRATTLEKGTTPTKKQASAAADRAEKAAAAKQQPAQPKIEAPEDKPKPVPISPKTAAEYEIYAEDWINRSGDPEKALARWDGEYDERDRLAVSMKTRSRLRELLDKKHGV